MIVASGQRIAKAATKVLDALCGHSNLPTEVQLLA
jgi:hypothetical protein